MAKLISTDDIGPDQRLDAWRHVVCDTLGPLDMRAQADAPLWGVIEAGGLGPLRVAAVTTSTPHSVHRTPGLIRRSNPELCRVVVPMSGSHVLAQDGRSSVLRAGEIGVYDFARPYELAYDAPVRLAVVSVPYALLAVDTSDVAAITATAMPATGAAALVAPTMHRLCRDVDTYSPATAARLSTVLLNLMSAAVAEQLDRTGRLPPQTRQSVLLTSLYAFIEQHLSDPRLAPAVVAAAHHISVRYLHRLFATSRRHRPLGSAGGASNGAEPSWPTRRTGSSR